jgi:hypothetical protein
MLESCCCFVVESGKIFSGEEQGSLQVAQKDGNSVHLVEIEPQHQPMHHVGWMVMWSGKHFFCFIPVS